MSRVVYTDGACRGNPGPGGWAWALDEDHWMSGAEAATTNQRMEIMAAFRAVEALEGPLEVRSDSTYVVKCFNDRWYRGWMARGWRNSQKQAVANRDLWEPFIRLVLDRGDVTFRWVKGHSSDPMNDLVDRLAVEAAQRGTGASRGLGELVGPGPGSGPRVAAPGSIGGPFAGGDQDPVDQDSGVRGPGDPASVEQASVEQGSVEQGSLF